MLTMVVQVPFILSYCFVLVSPIDFEPEGIHTIAHNFQSFQLLEDALSCKSNLIVLETTSFCFESSIYNLALALHSKSTSLFVVPALKQPY